MDYSNIRTEEQAQRIRSLGRKAPYWLVCKGNVPQLILFLWQIDEYDVGGVLEEWRHEMATCPLRAELAVSLGMFLDADDAFFARHEGDAGPLLWFAVLERRCDIAERILPLCTERLGCWWSLAAEHFDDEALLPVATAFFNACPLGTVAGLDCSISVIRNLTTPWLLPYSLNTLRTHFNHRQVARYCDERSAQTLRDNGI